MVYTPFKAWFGFIFILAFEFQIFYFEIILAFYVLKFLFFDSVLYLPFIKMEISKLKGQ